MPQSVTIPLAKLNKARHRLALSSLDRLLEKALDPRFTGRVIVEVHSKNGRLGQPKLTTDHFADPDFQD